jgi:putative SOS response-associated peptidase YedK
MFRGALAQRRCIVPADALYEWKMIEGGKQPYAIAVRTESRWPLQAYGKVSVDETVHRSFAIMTTIPNIEMSDLHN